MGGHGGLNILPQKRWNVYNYENREKVRKDEEAAAREEQIKREQCRKRDSEFRLDLLRRARGLSPPSATPENPGHINLFQGLEIEGFSSLSDPRHEQKTRDGRKGDSKDERSGKRRKNEEKPVAVAPEDEKYRMGYGVAGKGVKAPWYVMKPSVSSWAGEEREREEERSGKKKATQTGKKTIEELREERRRREKREKERERAVMAHAGRKRDSSLFGDRKSRENRFS